MKKAASPLKKALKALEARESLMKLNADRRLRALKETQLNAKSELQRLHGQSAMLPGLQTHMAQRRALAKAVGRKIKEATTAK